MFNHPTSGGHIRDCVDKVKEKISDLKASKEDDDVDPVEQPNLA